MKLRTIIAAMIVTPALAAESPQCALAGATPMVVVAPQPVVAQPAVPPGAQAIMSTGRLPADLAALPFVRHIAAAGAAITDFGGSHGMRAVAARAGDQFMIFQLTPDGQVAVAGAMTDLTFAQLTTLAGGDLTDLGLQHGLPTLFVRSGRQFQVFYATPDRERLIPGIMFDATGKDLTRDLVANVPGAVPTVVVADSGATPEAPPVQAKVSVTSALELVQKANAGAIGVSTAPHLWMLVDPQCIYSVRAYQMLRPFVDAGKVQLSIVPLSVLDYEDHGQSTKSALALLSKPADQMVAAWQAGSVGDPPAADAAARLAANMAIARDIDLHGTPTLIWRKIDGSEGRLDGLPTSVPALLASMGS